MEQGRRSWEKMGSFGPAEKAVSEVDADLSG